MLLLPLGAVVQSFAVDAIYSSCKHHTPVAPTVVVYLNHYEEFLVVGVVADFLAVLRLAVHQTFPEKI